MTIANAIRSALNIPKPANDTAALRAQAVDVEAQIEGKSRELDSMRAERKAALQSGSARPDRAPIVDAEADLADLREELEGLRQRLLDAEQREREARIAAALTAAHQEKDRRLARAAVISGMFHAANMAARHEGMQLHCPGLYGAYAAELNAAPLAVGLAGIRSAVAAVTAAGGSLTNPAQLETIGGPGFDKVAIHHSRSFERLLSKLSEYDYAEESELAIEAAAAEAQADADARAAEQAQRDLDEGRYRLWLEPLHKRGAIADNDEFTAACTVRARLQATSRDVPPELGKLITRYYILKRGEGVEMRHAPDAATLERVLAAAGL